jgi:hypothetical protein
LVKSSGINFRKSLKNLLFRQKFTTLVQAQ